MFTPTPPNEPTPVTTTGQERKKKNNFLDSIPGLISLGRRANFASCARTVCNYSQVFRMPQLIPVCGCINSL